MRIAVHVTHEAATKIGGIGAVLNGMCTAHAYKMFFDRTVLYGPLFDLGAGASSPLGGDGHVLFSTRDLAAGAGRSECGRTLSDILAKYNIDVVYGRRTLVNEYDPGKRNLVDVFLIGTSAMNAAEVGKFKYLLWKRFGIQSDLYEGNSDYEQYLRIAIPYLEILEGFCGTGSEYYHFAHEYMGIPAALSVVAAGRKHMTVFVAHEVPTARLVVEGHPGHDVSFYNLLQRAQGQKSLEDVFGSYRHHARSELVKRGVHLDRIFAVSDGVKAEYLFLQPSAPAAKVRTVYNGVSTLPMTLAEKLGRRRRVQEYLDGLLGFAPDVLLTRVTRLVVSKGIWRDIMLLYELEKIFRAHRLRGAYILLATVIGTGRSPEDVLRMEQEYGWPVTHRSGWPDLVGMEEETHAWLELFNARSTAIKALFINQFGFDRLRCGSRVPAEANLLDLRAAADAELGFSVYEPFGIAQVETVPLGGIAVLSSWCGSRHFVEEVFRESEVKPFHAVDFTLAGRQMSVEALKNLSRQQRDVMEREALSRDARRIFDALPRNEAQRERYLRLGQAHMEKMSWENIVQNHVLPNLST